MERRALVISGGGSFGAFAGGLATKMYEKEYRWSRFYGTSTGALLNTLIAPNEYELLKQVYTNVENKDIFSKPPFNQKGRLNILRALLQTIRGKTSIGNASNLLKLIKRTYTEKIHDNTINSGKVVCACVTNYTKGRSEFAYNINLPYDKFVLHTFASASVPLAMDLVKISGDEYMDGGVMEHVPLQQAINDGADVVDVIVLRPNYSEVPDNWKSNNVLNVTMRSIDLMMKEISESDLVLGRLKNTYNKNVQINIFYIPNDLKGNSLVFDKKMMKEWWDYGYRVVVPDPNTVTKNSGLSISQFRITIVDAK